MIGLSRSVRACVRGSCGLRASKLDATHRGPIRSAAHITVISRPYASVRARGDLHCMAWHGDRAERTGAVHHEARAPGLGAMDESDSEVDGASAQQWRTVPLASGCMAWGRSRPRARHCCSTMLRRHATSASGQDRLRTMTPCSTYYLGLG